MASLLVLNPSPIISSADDASFEEEEDRLLLSLETLCFLFREWAGELDPLPPPPFFIKGLVAAELE